MQNTVFWRHTLFILIASLAIYLSLYWSTTLYILKFWWISSGYSHGFLIIPISVYLVWSNRSQIAKFSPDPTLFGLSAIVVLSLLWWAARVTDVQTVQMMTLLLSIPALVWTLLGTRIARLLIFPLAYLLLAVPVWDLLQPILQDISSWMATRGLRIYGLPVYQEGHQITIPAGKFLVDISCSGLRYFLSALALGSLFAYLNYKSSVKRVVFTLLVVMVSLIGNWIRILTVILIGQHA